MSTIAKPYNFSAGTTIIATEHNENFDRIYNDYDGNITNANISNSAGITYAKLSLTGGIVNADVSGSAAITYAKLSLTGGIVNADVNASAGIVDTKLATISTAGKVSGAALTSLSSTPSGAGALPLVNRATNYAAGDYLLASADTERSGTPTSYTKVKEIYIPRGGTLRIKFDLKNTISNNNGLARIYRNGSAVGTVRATDADNAYHTHSEDISGWTSGDLVQLYTNTSDAGATTVYVKNFRIYENAPEREVVGVD